MAQEELKPQAEVTAEPAPVSQEPVQEVQEQADDKSRVQKRIDQLTAARRQAEERARMAEERAIRLELEQQQRVREQQPQGIPNREEKQVAGMPRSQWEEWHAEDPVAATEYLIDFKANKKAQEVISNLQTVSQYSETVQSVYKEHPELKEVMEGKRLAEETPFWQVYDEVAREMPEAQHIARGPYIVMKEAERRMKERQMVDKEKQIADAAAVKENERITRSASSYTAGSTSQRPPSAGSVKLTPDEEKVARKMGLSPELYASYKKEKK